MLKKEIPDSMSGNRGASPAKKAITWRRGAELLGAAAAWVWAVVAGGGGLDF
jgi:hypothetical protein